MDDPFSRKRAEAALTAIEKFEEIHRNDPKVRKAYLSYIKNAPILIRRHGLGQALAIILSQSQGQGDEQAYKAIYDHLEGWLCSDAVTTPFNEDDKLLRSIVQSSQQKYFKAQEEAGLYIELLKKFANAFLSDGLDDEEGQS